jgi:proteasome lid subunit RPN8/RPN11
MTKQLIVDGTPEAMVSSAVRSMLCDLGRLARPREACGALLGRCEYGSYWEIDSVFAVDNAATDATREFLIPAERVRELERHAASANLQLAGFFHSHPVGPAHPSATDNQRAWPGYLYGIVDATAGEVRFFTLEPAGCVLVEVSAPSR